MGEGLPMIPSSILFKYQGRDFHPKGPEILPLHKPAKVASDYESLIRNLSIILPGVKIVSSNPAPRRSSGFATTRAREVEEMVKKQGDYHHHLGLCSGFVGKRRSAGGSNAPGGRFPIRDELFLPDGIVPCQSSFNLIFERTYAALTYIFDRPSTGPLDSVKVWF